MRPPLPRQWTLVGPIPMGVVLAMTPAVAAPPGAPDPVRVTYSAPPECPGEDVFLAAVRERIGTEWEAPPGRLARTIDVTVRATPARSVARIDFVDDGGNHVSRSVSGETCSEVVAGIALVTALAIESRVPELVDKSEPVAPPSNDATPPATAELPPPVAAPPVAPPSRPPDARASARPGTHHFDIGVAGVASSGVGPAPAFGARFVAGVGWPRGPDLRIGFDYLATPSATVAEQGGIRVQMYQLGARASGCPIALPLGSAVRVLPCAGVAAGIAHAETLPSAGVKTTGAANPPYVAPLAELRVDVSASALFVEVSGEVRFVVDNPTFGIETANGQLPVYPVPAVAFGGSVALGLRL